MTTPLINPLHLKKVEYLSQEIILKHGLTDDMLQELKHETDLCCFYYDDTDNEHPFCFWDGYFFYPLKSLDPKDFLHTPCGGVIDFVEINIFTSMKNHFYHLYDGQHWEALLFYAHPRSKYILFQNLMPKLPEHLKKELFLDMYESNPTDLHLLNRTFLRTLLDMETPERFLPVKEPDEMVTIYQGMATGKEPLTEMYSWMLHKDASDRYSKRYGNLGYVIEAKVRKNDIKAYIHHRRCTEVLLFPESVIYHH